MRRLSNSRTGQPDAANLEGFDSTHLEGDPLAAGIDAIASLRPFGRDIPEQRLGHPPDDLAAEGDDLGRALALARRGRRLDAILALRKLCRDQADAIEPRIALADLLDQAGETDQAIEELTAAADIALNPAPILVRRGALYAQTGSPKEAEKDFREAMRRDVNHWPAYRYLGVTRLRLGGTGEAIAVLRDALKMAPQDPETALYLGEAYFTQGQIDEAHQLLNQAVELDPKDPRGYTLLGRLLDRLGRTDEAMAMHRKAREVTTA